MILDRFRVDGRAAIVTGASRGIGAAIARALAEAGADVALAARTPEALERVAGEVEGFGRRAVAVPCDVNRREDLERLVECARSAFGRLDILVNNAGGSPPRPALRTSERLFEAAFRFNVTQAFVLSRLCIPSMLEGGGGAIVNISSAISRLVDRGFVAYGTAKAALNHMTRMLAFEMAPRVRVNAIAVGAVATDALRPFLEGRPELRRTMEERTPLGRLGEPEDIAAAALYLASPAASWVTGRILQVDGGIEASNWPLDVTTAEGAA